MHKRPLIILLYGFAIIAISRIFLRPILAGSNPLIDLLIGVLPNLLVSALILPPIILLIIDSSPLSKNHKASMFLVLSLSFLIPLGWELLQLLEEINRTFDPWDIFASLLGIVIAYVLLFHSQINH